MTQLLIFLIGLLLTPEVSSSAVQQSYESVVWDDIQEYQANLGRPEYVVNEELCELAEKRVIEIQTDWSHNGFLNLEAWPVGYEKLGENLSKEFYLSYEVLPAWLHSPTHKENLDYNFTDSCLVCVDMYCAHEFGNRY